MAQERPLRLTKEPGLSSTIPMAVAVLDDGTEIRIRNLGDRVEVRTWDATRSCRPPALHVHRVGKHVIDVRPITPNAARPEGATP